MVVNEIQINKLVKEMCDVLSHYGWAYTEHGVRKIVLTWADAKADLIETLRHHPNWNEEKLMITLSQDYERSVDKEKLMFAYNYLNSIRGRLRVVNPEYEKQENMNWDSKYYRTGNIIKYLKDKYLNVQKVEGYTKVDLPELYAQKFEYYRKWDEFNKMSRYTQESLDHFWTIDRLAEFIYDIANGNHEEYINIIDDSKLGKLDYVCEYLKTKPVKGQKIMKCFRKILIECGVDKQEKWNELVAKLGDGLNPLHYTRHTILSLNPIDNLRSSMGTSWSSCHTIDRNNVDGRNGDNYEGMHAKGNLSYMLDSVTAVFYTVHKEYDGVDFELQDKVNRMLVHIGNEDNPFFVQGRVYPQSNDYEGKELYKSYRTVVQSILAECWKVPNSWQAPISSEDNRDYFTSKGSHYRDYTCFNNCKISRLSGRNAFKMITIGNQELCVECGEKHYGADNELSCCTRFNGIVICYECGDEIDEEDARIIDGDYYCDDCSFFCEYHEEYEVVRYADPMYIENYGRVCESAYENGNFFTCECCGYSYYLDGDEIEASDGSIFCCESCAENSDYYYVPSEDRYYYCDDIYYCHECGDAILRYDAVEINGNHYCRECSEDICTE